MSFLMQTINYLSLNFKARARLFYLCDVLIVMNPYTSFYLLDLANSRQNLKNKFIIFRYFSLLEKKSTIKSIKPDHSFGTQSSGLF
ncbi:hypothetical protein BpHYR1_005525 [Brachionus plicatilis]|uniref:Uncharacterized protein n=1 Tax=Brachionus plicatilis TaxID=10195 RepID=A0A3M7Q8Q4_BRAPC|nr:hypothetical protein BpHYR1_005525 [Brachionus plicatilis]